MIKRSVYIILLLLTVTLLNSCATFMKGKYYSRLDPEYRFNLDDPIIVTVDKNDLESKYYVSEVIEALKNRGFNNVYSHGNQEDYQGTFKGILFITLKKIVDTYKYQSANYGDVDSGKSTINCYSIGNSVNCTENREKERGVIGYSTKTGVVTVYAFVLDWYDIYSQERVYRIAGGSYEKNCVDDKVFSFLIKQTIARADFNRPEDYEYRVKMPEGYRCK